MGSIKLDRGGTNVTLTDGLQVVRSVSRPESTLQPTTNALPDYIDRDKAAKDVFEISGSFTSSSAESDAKTLIESIIRDPLGRGDLTLTFVSSLFGYSSSFTVFPEGSGAVRIVYTSSTRDWIIVPRLQLRVVNNTT